MCREFVNEMIKFCFYVTYMEITYMCRNLLSLVFILLINGPSWLATDGKKTISPSFKRCYKSCFSFLVTHALKVFFCVEPRTVK